jgi:IclR family acetate operon transcriptional repressor
MKSVSPLAGVDNALCILHRLAQSGATGIGLTRLATEMGMNKASVHRMLQALRYRDYVRQESTGNYRLGPATLQLADAYLRDKQLQGIFHDSLRELCRRTRQICHLAIRMDEDIVYVDKVEPPHPIGTWSKIGWGNPALTTALGRAILCQQFVDYESFAAEFPTPVEQRTPQSRVSPNEVWPELVEARQRGYAVEDQELGMGVSCLAVAVSRGSKVIAAISITGPSSQVSLQHAPQLIAQLHQCITPDLPPGLTLQKPLARVGTRRRAPLPAARLRADGPVTEATTAIDE